MIKLGITGGIGAGKSFVSNLLRKYSIPVYDCDEEAKRLALTSKEIKDKLTLLLGDQLYSEGVLDKKMLADYLFSNQSNANRINQIIHPIVKRDFELWVSRHSIEPIVALESAILIEAGFADSVDRVLLVSAPEEIRIARVVKRDNTSEELVKLRMEHQLSDDAKRELAHFEICNDGNMEIETTLRSILHQLCVLG